MYAGQLQPKTHFGNVARDSPLDFVAFQMESSSCLAKVRCVVQFHPTTRVARGQGRRNCQRGATVEANAAIDSCAVFRRLREGDVIPRGVRFQVSIPTAMAIMTLIRDNFQIPVEAVYEDALLKEVARIQAEIPKVRSSYPVGRRKRDLYFPRGILASFSSVLRAGLGRDLGANHKTIRFHRS